MIEIIIYSENYIFADKLSTIKYENNFEIINKKINKFIKYIKNNNFEKSLKTLKYIRLSCDIYLLLVFELNICTDDYENKLKILFEFIKNKKYIFSKTNINPIKYFKYNNRIQLTIEIEKIRLRKIGISEKKINNHWNYDDEGFWDPDDKYCRMVDYKR